jgi:hypothetical protein
MSLVQIYIAKDGAEAVLVSGFLENVGIKSFINPLNDNLPMGYGDTLYRSHGINVEASIAEEAKKILSERK